MTNPFASLGMKIAAGLQLLSIAIIVFLLLAKAGETRRADKLQVALGKEVAAHKLTVAEVEKKTAAAKAHDLEHARQVERADSTINQEQSNVLQKQLADARRRADALRVQLRETQADRGGSENPDLSRAPDAPGGIAGPAFESGFPVEDALICTENSIRLQGWQEWWAKVSAVPR